jgi:hypothetical protein
VLMDLSSLLCCVLLSSALLGFSELHWLLSRAAAAHGVTVAAGQYDWSYKAVQLIGGCAAAALWWFLSASSAIVVTARYCRWVG